MRKTKLQRRIQNVGVAALARETGFSEGAVSQKMTAGKTPDEIRQEAAIKHAQAPFTGTKAEKKPKPKPKTPTASEYDLIVSRRQQLDALDSMKFRRAKALAERSELDNMLKRGELLPVSYVRLWASRYLIDGRDTLLAGPSELRDQLAAESDPMKIDDILRRWLERAMAKFHQLEKLWGEGVEQEEVA